MTIALGESVRAMSDCLDSVRGTPGGLDDKARMRVEHAAMVSTRRTTTSGTPPPRLPAAALAAEEISTGQLQVITETMAALPASVPEPAWERAEADLVGYARDFDPHRLRIIAHQMLASLDPDGPPPGEDPAAATPVRGELRLRDRRDGRLEVEGWLDPKHGGMARTLIEQLATRRPTTDDGIPDTGTVPQLQADTLIGSRSGYNQHEHHRIPERAPQHRLPRRQFHRQRPFRATRHGRTRQPPIGALHLLGRRDITEVIFAVEAGASSTSAAASQVQ